MQINLTKTLTGLIPSDEETNTWFQKLKLGQVVAADFRKVRNPAFHRKLFALLNLGYSYWNPGKINSKYGVPEKNFDRFRKDITILAGYHHSVVRLDGSVRIEADSISFAKMDSDTFEKLYNNVLTVILNKVTVLNTMTKDEVNTLVDKILTYA